MTTAAMASTVASLGGGTIIVGTTAADIAKRDRMPFFRRTIRSSGFLFKCHFFRA